jgi:hypothetical protein
MLEVGTRPTPQYMKAPILAPSASKVAIMYFNASKTAGHE